MASKKLDHPALDHLSATPEILRLLMTGVSEEQTQAKPAPDRWSIAEVLEHLSHVEGHCFRLRIDRMLKESSPEIETYDQEVHTAAGTYSNREAEESFAHWEEQRDSNLEILRALDTSLLGRAAKHPELGIITIEDVLRQWAFHDLGHVKQIAELVRMRMYPPIV